MRNINFQSKNKIESKTSGYWKICLIKNKKLSGCNFKNILIKIALADSYLKIYNLDEIYKINAN